MERQDKKRFYKAIPGGFSDWDKVKIIVITDDEIVVYFNNGKLPRVLSAKDSRHCSYEPRHNNKNITRIPEAEAALIF